MKDEEIEKAINEGDSKAVKRLLNKYSHSSLDDHLKTTLELIRSELVHNSSKQKINALFSIALTLADHGADINTHTDSDHTFILLCVDHKKQKYLKECLDNHIEKIDAESFFDALGRATENKDMTLMMLRNSHFDYTNYRALHIMAENGCIDGMQWLLDHGCDIDMRDGDDSTPLICAAAFGEKQIITFLLDHGANPLLRNVHGENAIDMLCKCFDNRTYDKHVFKILESAMENRQLNNAILNVDAERKEDLQF